MAITRVHHHTFTVSDMDRSIPFYRDVLGFKLIADVFREKLPEYDKVMGMQNVRVRVVMFNDPAGTMVALLQYHNPVPIKRKLGNIYVGATVLAVQTDNIQADYQRMVKAGVRFQSEPVDVVRDGKLAVRIAYAFDPDGLVIELYEPVP